MSKKIFVQTIVIFILFIGNALMPSVLSLEQPRNHPAESITSEHHPDLISSSASNYYAVIAACSQYKNPSYDLPKKPFHPFSDAKLSVLYNSLLQSKNWNESHIIFLLNDHATKQNITDALVSMAGIVGPNDFFLFSWCGHGTEVNDTDGDESHHDPTDTTDEAICPYDIYFDNNLTKHNVITDDELGHYFSNITCKGMCLIFDCCLSGGMVDRNTTNATMDIPCESATTSAFTKAFIEELKGPRSTDVNGDNRVVLMSTKPDMLERGIYLTGFPLEVGLAFACTHVKITDKNNNGVISAEEAFRIARPLVYIQSSVYWAGAWLYEYSLLHSVFLASLMVLYTYIIVQKMGKLMSNYEMGNFPIMQDDYDGELPLIQV